MIARGPTMSADGKIATGSMHIVDLPDSETADVFAHDDPLANGGVFEEIMVRRFQYMSDWTMWQFAGNAANPRFLFIGEADPAPLAQRRELLEAQRHFSDRRRADSIIVSGPVLGGDSETWGGSAILLEAPDWAGAQALVAGDPAAELKLDRHTQLHRWRFGGEENLQDLIARC